MNAPARRSSVVISVVTGQFATSAGEEAVTVTWCRSMASFDVAAARAGRWASAPQGGGGRSPRMACAALPVPLTGPRRRARIRAAACGRCSTAPVPVRTMGQFKMPDAGRRSVDGEGTDVPTSDRSRRPTAWSAATDTVNVPATRGGCLAVIWYWKLPQLVGLGKRVTRLIPTVRPDGDVRHCWVVASRGRRTWRQQLVECSKHPAAPTDRAAPGRETRFVSFFHYISVHAQFCAVRTENHHLLVPKRVPAINAGGWPDGGGGEGLIYALTSSSVATSATLRVNLISSAEMTFPVYSMRSGMP